MKGDLCVYAPQTMQVAVSVSSNGFVAIGQHENSLWLFACLQLFALAALCGFQNNPFDEMLFEHWVSHFANGNGDLVALYADDRNVFFRSSIYAARNQFAHLFAAADNRNAFALFKSDDISSVFANI